MELYPGLGCAVFVLGGHGGTDRIMCGCTARDCTSENPATGNLHQVVALPEVVVLGMRYW